MRISNTPHGASAIDRYLPAYDVRSHHEIEVDAPITATHKAVRELDLARSVPVAALLFLRAIPHFVTGKARPTRSITLENALQLGFIILEDQPPNELVIGAVGKFWRPDSGFVPVTPDQFRTFDQPGYAKCAMTFTIEEHHGGSLLSTETRVVSTDGSARRKFSLYWRVIGPFSGLIRTILLRQIKRAALGYRGIDP